VGSRALKAVRAYLDASRPGLLRRRTARALFVTTRGPGLTRQGFW
jgi:site-specific recombinase XerD